MMINLNSKESYLSLMGQVRALERNLSSADEGKAAPDFPEQLKTLSSIQQAIRKRSSQEDIPAQFKGIHRVLESTVQDLSKRVAAAADKMEAASSLSPPAKGGSYRWTAVQIAGGFALMGAAALCCAKFWPEIQTIQPFSPNPPPPPPPTPPPPPPLPQNNGAPLPLGTVTVEPPGFCDPLPLFETEFLFNHSLARNGTLFGRPIPVNDSPGGLLGANDHTGITTAVWEMIPKPISGHVLDAVRLGGLLLARSEMVSAMPILCLVGLHRGYQLVRVSGVTDLLKYLAPGFGANLEGAAQEWESTMGIPTSRMLESMTNIDRWAAVGFMAKVRDFSGIRSYMPFGSWRLLQFAPFLIHPGSNGNIPNLTISNGTLAIHPGNEKNMGGYLWNLGRDLGYLGYIFATVHALNVASPLLNLALSSHVFHIIRLANVTGPLKAQMPLLADGLEKTARFYSQLEEKMPPFVGKMFESVTNMNSWALIGVADLLRSVPRVQQIAGRIPYLSYLIANNRGWSFTRYAPIIVGGVLQAAGLGLNLQQRLLGF
jgi:hypothetical protein